MKSFGMKTQILSGNNALEYLATLPATQVAVVTDQTMVTIGVLDKVSQVLSASGHQIHVFHEVEADPSVETVKKGLQLIIEHKINTLVALGGGSVIDAAKAMMFFCLKSKEMLVQKEAIRKPQFIAIPTTSGTGSEVTSFAVITDHATQTKVPLTDALMLPDVALLDARLTLSVPPTVTADTGVDVITHAVEAFVAKEAGNFSTLYAEKAFTLALQHLITAYEQGDDLPARQAMHEASCMAGIAFTNAGLGINHSLAHAIGGRFKISHGRANAILLPHVMAFNSGLIDNTFSQYGEPYVRLATCAGIQMTDQATQVSALIKVIEKYQQRLGISSCFQQHGIEKNEYLSRMPQMAAAALSDVCTSGNPRKVTQAHLEMILKRAYGEA